MMPMDHLVADSSSVTHLRTEERGVRRKLAIPLTNHDKTGLCLL